MHFKSVQIFFDLKKADRCKKWWICSKNPKITNFCVFLWYHVICLAWLAMLFAFRCQVSINQWAPVTHHLSFCSSGLAMSLSAACRRLANVLFCLPCFLDPFHWFIPPIWNPTLNKVICANSPNRSYKAPVHGSNSLAGCFQCFSFFHCSCLISLKHIVSYYWSIACFHFFHVCSFFFILLHYFSFCCMFFHFVAFISVYFILFHFFSFLFRYQNPAGLILSLIDTGKYFGE